MKKTTIMSLVSYLNDVIATAGGEDSAPGVVVGARDELAAELNKGAEKAQANRDLYAQAHDVVIEGLREANAPVTIAELFESIESRLPEGFGKGKVQHGVTRMWVDEIVKTEGKVNTYSLKE